MLWMMALRDFLVVLVWAFSFKTSQDALDDGVERFFGGRGIFIETSQDNLDRGIERIILW